MNLNMWDSFKKCENKNISQCILKTGFFYPNMNACISLHELLLFYVSRLTSSIHFVHFDMKKENLMKR